MSIPYPASKLDQGHAFFQDVFGLEEIPSRPCLHCYDPAGNRIEVTQILGPYR